MNVHLIIFRNGDIVMTLAKIFFEDFAEKFNLILPLDFDKETKKISFDKIKEKIASEEIDIFLQNFFKDRNFVIRKNQAGFFFTKGKERVFVSVTNFSEKTPFSLIVSIQIFSSPPSV